MFWLQFTHRCPLPTYLQPQLRTNPHGIVFSDLQLIVRVAIVGFRDERRGMALAKSTDHFMGEFFLDRVHNLPTLMTLPYQTYIR